MIEFNVSISRRIRRHANQSVMTCARECRDTILTLEQVFKKQMIMLHNFETHLTPKNAVLRELQWT